MAIAYHQEVVVMGNAEKLTELFPFWHKGNLSEKIWVSSAMDYACPMSFKELSKQYPDLVFLENYVCDVDGMRQIEVIANGQWRHLYNEALEEDMGGEFEFEFKKTEYKDAWRKFLFMNIEELRDLVKLNGCVEKSGVDA